MRIKNIICLIISLALPVAAAQVTSSLTPAKRPVMRLLERPSSALYLGQPLAQDCPEAVAPDSSRSPWQGKGHGKGLLSASIASKSDTSFGGSG